MPGPSTPDDRPTTRGEGRMNDFEFDFRLPTCDLTGYRKKEKGKRREADEGAILVGASFAADYRRADDGIGRVQTTGGLKGGNGELERGSANLDVGVCVCVCVCVCV